jgi:hypothetical protein
VGNVHKRNITAEDNILNVYDGEMEINSAVKKIQDANCELSMKISRH